MTSQTKTKIYLFFTILGFILPNWVIFETFRITGEFDFGLFFEAMNSSLYARFIASDFLITATTCLVYYILEWRAGKLGRWAATPLLGTFLVGISFGFPLFLLIRELNSSRQ
jgi:Terpene cyclase DEP1